MNKGLEALKLLYGCVRCENSHNLEICSLAREIIENELKKLELVKKCFYVAKSSGAILLTGYGFEHEEKLKEVLK